MWHWLSVRLPGLRDTKPKILGGKIEKEKCLKSHADMILLVISLKFELTLTKLNYNELN